MKRFKLFKIGFFILFSLLIISYAHAGSLPDEWTGINPADYEFEYNDLTPACSNRPNAPQD